MVCYNSPTSRLNVGNDKTTVELLTIGTMDCLWKYYGVLIRVLQVDFLWPTIRDWHR